MQKIEGEEGEEEEGEDEDEEEMVAQPFEQTSVTFLLFQLCPCSFRYSP